MAGEWDVVGNAPAQLQNPWAVKSVAPAPPSAMDRVEHGLSRTPLGVAAGVGENALSGITAGIGSLVDAVTGAAPGTHNFTYQPRTPAGKVLADVAGRAGGAVNEDAAQLGGHFVGLGSNPANAQAATDTLRERIPEALGATGVVAGAGGLLDAGASALENRSAAAAAAAANAPTAVVKYGARTGADQPIARSIADKSAQPTVTAHNQGLADPTIGAQAGVKPGTSLTQQGLEAAQEPANSVYNRAENSLPTALLSPKAAGMVNGVGGEDLVTRSPDVQAQIAAQKQRLLSGPMSGPQVVNTSKSLRYNGFRNAASEDPEQNALGDAQLKMADALHQHMVDSLQENSPVSAEQLADARRALAQNYTVGSLLKGNNVDLQALARLYRNQPNLLTGPLRDWAEFADLHPEVTSLPSKEERFNPSGFAKDITSIDLKRPITYAQPFFGALARRTLTGGKAPTPQVPVTGLGGEFGPLAPRQPPPLGLEAPPGAALEPHQQGMDLPQAPEPSLPLGTALSPGGKQRGSFSLREIPGNGNETSGGASVEAFNRGTRNLVTWDGDTATPISRDVNQVDRHTPPKGSVTLDADTGELVSSGNTPRGHIEGLLARWRKKNDLGHSFQ